MMDEVMRLTTFFATLAVSSLFATSIAVAAAGAMNTSGRPLLCGANCGAHVQVAAKSFGTHFHSRRGSVVARY
jgi:hypothetical protein